MTFDRIPPQNIEAEKSVLSSILLESDCIITVNDTIKPDYFYRTAHRHIYNSMLKLFQAEIKIDLVTVADQLLKMNLLDDVGGQVYLTELHEYVPSSANVKHYADILSNRYKLRKLIESMQTCSQKAFDCENPEQIINNLNEKIIKIINNDDIETDTETIAFNALDEIDDERNGKITGLKIPLPSVDDILGQIMPGETFVIGAVPGVGKTTISSQIAVSSVYLDNKKGAFFSLEMPSTQIIRRMFSQISGIEIWKINKGEMTREETFKFNEMIGMIKSKKNDFLIFDTIFNISDIGSKLTFLKQRNNIDFAVIDYLQLIDGNGENENVKIQNISKQLKVLAKKLKISIIIPSQLIKIEAGKEPEPYHLRGSGGIFQDADKVLLLHRPEEIEDTTYFLIKKNRRGTMGRCENIIFNKSINLFKETY